MAIIGIKYPVAAELSAETPAYNTGFIIGKAIAANINIEGGDANQLFADDMPVESDSSFQGGTIELGVDDLTDLNYATLLGHVIASESGASVVIGNANDVAPNLGIGFYKTRKKSGVLSYRATWLYKVQFSEPSDETQTKGETIEWQTPTISGNIMVLPNGDWKRQATFATEADAIAWLESKASIGQPVSKTDLAADIAAAQALTPATYSSESYAVVYYRLQLAIAVNANPDATQDQVDAAEDALEAAITALVTL